LSQVSRRAHHSPFSKSPSRINFNEHRTSGPVGTPWHTALTITGIPYGFQLRSRWNARITRMAGPFLFSEDEKVIDRYRESWPGGEGVLEPESVGKGYPSRRSESVIRVGHRRRDCPSQEALRRAARVGAATRATAATCATAALTRGSGAG
jgi:hypothetical protein